MKVVKEIAAQVAQQIQMLKLCLLIIVGMLTMASGMAFAQLTPNSATQILNQATSTFTDQASGLRSNLNSNLVTTIVGRQINFTLTASQNKVAAPGASVSFQHSVTNLGNSADSFALSLIDTYPGTFNFNNAQIFADANSDGVADSATPITSSPVLNPGESFYFIVQVQLPVTASGGQEDRIVARAISTSGLGLAQINTDTVTVTNSAVIQVTKGFSLTQGPSPNTGLVVTLNYSNIGNANATNVVMTDVIGAMSTAPVYDTRGLEYVAESGQWQGVAVSDAAGGDASGVNYQVSFVNGVATVSATVANVAPNSSGTIRFVVNVKPGLLPGIGTTTNAASVSYFDGVSNQTGVTNNSVYYRVVSGGPDLTLTKTHQGTLVTGVDGTFVLQVRNDGSGPSTAPVTVTDVMPDGLVINTAALPNGGASGWICNAVAQTITCTSSQLIGNGQAHPNPIFIKAKPSLATNGTPLVNRASVSGGGEATQNAGNNQASDSFEVSSSASVSGRAWFDVNHNGRYDPTEPPAGGILVELLNDSGVVVARTTTNPDGSYLISNVLPGPGYRLIFRLPDGSSPIVSSPVNGEQGQTNKPSDAVIRQGIFDGLTLYAGRNIVEQSLKLDPSGVVYNSVTREPVAGAIVALVGPAGFDPALHLVGGAANSIQTTGARGFYQFILLPNAPTGLYALQIQTPSGYANGPSALIQPAASVNCGVAACLDPTGLGVKGGTYSVHPANLYTAPPVGQATTYFLNFFFDTSTDPDVINNHIPIDPISIALPGLILEKNADRAVAEIGDIVKYSLTVRNRGAAPFANVRIEDQLPFGFKLVPGSVIFNRAGAPDPKAEAGRTLNFTGLGTIAPDAQVNLSYLAKLVPGAQDGNGINRARAFSGNVSSNQAIAKVRINAGVFTTKGVVLGKIFVDCNNNHIQDPEELGIPGVRLFLEDGTYVVSDSEGKYSFAGISARTHVLKVDPITLPQNSQMIAISNRHSGIGDSRFVDMKSGELHRADFAEGSCSVQVMDQVIARRKKAEVFSIETEKVLATPLDVTRRVGQAFERGSDAKAAPASGVLGGSSSTNSEQSFGPLAFNQVLSTAPLLALNKDVAPATTPEQNQSDLLSQADNTFAWIDLRDGDTLPIDQVNVRIKGVLGATIKLQVNGQDVPEHRIGTKAQLSDRNVQMLEFIGLPLKAGKNVLSAKQLDSFGNDRGQLSLTVIAPDAPGKLVIEFSQTNAVADGVTPAQVRVKITDQNGVSVTARTAVTLETTHGRWLVEDLDRNEPGVQTFIVGGSADFSLAPPMEPIQATIRVSSGALKTEKPLHFLPELRALVASGVIEGVINARSFSSSALQAVRARDGFEQTLVRLSRESSDGKRSASARTAFFLKGKVKGDYLLTLAFDSEKEARDRLFRDIQPDEYYPVYGDSSIKGFDAQSTSRLYVRVDSNKSWLLYGDFSSAALNPAQRLAQYQRSMTGLRHHYEHEGTIVDSFVSRDNLRQIFRELPANGTSGPYEFTITEALVNSERVEIITRDRNQPAQIIKSVLLNRFVDYGFEPLTGRLLLRAPLPSLDPNLNPVSIRFSAELDQGGPKFWVGGASAQFLITPTVTLGGSVVINQNPIPEAFKRLASVNAQWKPTESTTLTTEVAQTISASAIKGQAERIELTHDTTDLKVRASVAKAGSQFDNPASSLSKGRSEANAKLDYTITKGTILNAEAIASKDDVRGDKRQGVLFGITQDFSNLAKLEVGVRQIREQVGTPTPGVAAQSDTSSVHAKVTAPVPGLEAATAYVEAEQDVKNSSKRLLAIGGEYFLGGKGKLYARHEFESGLQGAFSLNSVTRQNVSILGVSTDYMENGTLFSEYRGRDSFGVRTTEAAIGLKNIWKLADGLKLNTNVERVKALSGKQDNESKAVALGLDYTANSLWKASTRLEWRDGPNNTSWLNTADVAAKLSRDWTVLGRHIINTVQTKAQASALLSDRLLHRVQAGVAYRQTDTNLTNALAMIEHKRERDTALSAEAAARTVQIASVHADYQPWRAWVFSGRAASKWVKETISGSRYSSASDMLGARAKWDVTERWDASVQGSVLRERGSGVKQVGLGIEAGYQLKSDLWVSMGYNFLGYRDRDLNGDEQTQKGIYLRLRFKFDEDLFGSSNK